MWIRIQDFAGAAFTRLDFPTADTLNPDDDNDRIPDDFEVLPVFWTD
jgi:hypothetical protein